MVAAAAVVVKRDDDDEEEKGDGVNNLDFKWFKIINLNLMF